MGEQTGGRCNCKFCILGRSLGMIKDKLNAEEIATIKEIAASWECAEADLNIAETKLAAIKKVCEGGLTAATDILEGGA